MATRCQCVRRRCARVITSYSIHYTKLYEVKASGHITRPVADEALSMLDVDHGGLDLMDRKLLSAVIDKFGGGPVGVDNLAAAIGEARDSYNFV